MHGIYKIVLACGNEDLGVILGRVPGRNAVKTSYVLSVMCSLGLLLKSTENKRQSVKIIDKM